MPDDLVTPDQIAAALADESLMRQVLNGLTDEVLRLQRVNQRLIDAALTVCLLQIPLPDTYEVAAAFDELLTAANVADGWRGEDA